MWQNGNWRGCADGTAPTSYSSPPVNPKTRSPYFPVTTVSPRKCPLDQCSQILKFSISTFSKFPTFGIFRRKCGKCATFFGQFSENLKMSRFGNRDFGIEKWENQNSDLIFGSARFWRRGIVPQQLPSSSRLFIDIFHSSFPEHSPGSL